ncbi:hypothetical protein K438DRAFT_1732429 [Mycena galopus ATCC 62051]|nr:hypothetical protein K438DRAFT_1732429 [Mycena galopus ATCC 62051]
MAPTHGHPQYFDDRSQQHYRPHVEDQWTSPPPYYAADPTQYYVPPPGPPMPTAMPPSAFQQPSRFPDAGEYLRNQLNLPFGATVNLWSLPEPAGGERPSIPLPMLIKLAIYGSPKKRLTLQEIYGELANRFQWFREHQHEQAWKSSIRHNLSLKKMFVNTPRPVTEPGKGSYWELDITAGEGNSRLRKRSKKNASRDEDDVSDDSSSSENDHTDAENRATATARRHSPYSQGGSRLRANSDRSHRSSSPPIPGGGSHSRAVPMIDPPASQRRPSAYGQPGYSQAYVPINPAQSSGPSSLMPPPGHALSHSRSAIPLDAKPSGRLLRPRPSLSSTMLPPSSITGGPVSPTDEAYAKSRRRASGRH